MNGPFDPKDIPPISEIETATLEAIKIAARAELAPQIAHDVELRQMYDVVTDRMILQLSSFIYGLKGDHTTQRVPYSRRVQATKEAVVVWKPPIGYAALTFVAGIVALISGALWLALAIAIIVVLQSIALGPRSVAVPVEFDETVHGEVEITAESWTVFPENSMIFPKALGKPQQVVRYSTRENFFGDE